MITPTPATAADRPTRRGAQPSGLDVAVATLVALIGLPLAMLGPSPLPIGVVLDLALFPPLLWRRRSPMLAFSTVAAIVFAQWFAGPSGQARFRGVGAYHLVADVALLLTFYTVAAYRSRAETIVAAVGLEIALLAGTVMWVGRSSGPALFVLLSGTAAAAGVTGRNAWIRRAYLESVEQRAATLELERDHQARLVAAAERARIARDMHDVVAHNISVMIALADGASYAADTNPSAAAEAMAQVAATGRQALGEMRLLLGVLRDGDRPPSVQPQPGLADLDALITQVRLTGLRASLVTEGPVWSLPAGLQLAGYRLVQEALTNTLKHAVDAESSIVRVGVRDSRLEIDVIDDGRPPPPTRGAGHGIEGMRERAAVYGGVVEAGNATRHRVVRASHVRSRRACARIVTVSVLLVDDQALLRAGFRMVLEAHEDITVVGEAGDGEEAIVETARLSPDVVLMDVRMPGMDGIEATRVISRQTPTSRVLILTTFDLDEHAFAGLRAGASGFLLKDVPPQDLIAAIHVVASGDAVVAPRVTRRLLENFATQSVEPTATIAGDQRLTRLTERETEVLGEVALGLTNHEIATRLCLSEATVKTHVGRILSKLELRDRVQAVIFAYEVRLVTPA